MFEEVVHWVLTLRDGGLKAFEVFLPPLQISLELLLGRFPRLIFASPREVLKLPLELSLELLNIVQRALYLVLVLYECSLRAAWVQPEGTPASEDDPSDSWAEDAQELEMATTPVADDAPTVSAMPGPLTSPQGEEQPRSMEVDDGDDHQPPASPVSHQEDELLTGRDVVGVGGMANLTVSSPRGGDGR